MEEIINSSDSHFEDDIRDEDRLVLVDMWADWCGPCKMMEPILEEVAQEYSENIKVVKLNIDQNQGTPLKYGVMNIPTLLLFKKGKEVDRVIGAFPKNQLLKRIQNHF